MSIIIVTSRSNLDDSCFYPNKSILNRKIWSFLLPINKDLIVYIDELKLANRLQMYGGLLGLSANSLVVVDSQCRW
ncbi:hypothetical protein GUJ93_ZPchr0001g32347 [Zizania palustris]|uniref:Uncharacterized protein n=1 Tax=Zizania palustris TaxID=103762 RepID=A0A8J5RFQ5_ZIZPA|nr:hypothetical protein GUJ93_ZPchr0001g32347 [Zizania palustris]